jgi:hypothetical protein
MDKVPRGIMKIARRKTDIGNRVEKFAENVALY